jgi:hypothetical protein
MSDDYEPPMPEEHDPLITPLEVTVDERGDLACDKCPGIVRFIMASGTYRSYCEVFRGPNYEDPHTICTTCKNKKYIGSDYEDREDERSIGGFRAISSD